MARALGLALALSLAACASAVAAESPAGRRQLEFKPATQAPTPVTTSPWLARLLLEYADGSAYLCGGTLVSPTAVLTAAHCLEDSPNNMLTTIYVRLGVFNSSDYEEPGTEAYVAASWFANAGFQPGASGDNLVNDLAIVYLPTPSALQPVALDRGGDAASVGHAVEALGFGSTWPVTSEQSTDYSSVSRILQRVRLGIVDGGWCADARGYFNGVQQVCAGRLAGGADTCQGDSGGPLMALQSGGDGWQMGMQVALVSYGYGCAQPYSAGIYTRISAYMPWIQQAVPDLPAAVAATSVTPSLEPAAGSVICGAAPWGNDVWLDCGALTVGQVVSATWGRTGYDVCTPPAGATLAASTSATATCCVGKNGCAAPASETQFGSVLSNVAMLALKNSGYLSVYVRAICGAPASWPALPPPPPQPPQPSPPPRARPASPPPPLAHGSIVASTAQCRAAAPYAGPPPPSPPPPSPPPALAAAVAATLTFKGVASLTTAKRTALAAALRIAAMPTIAASDAAITITVLDYSYATTVSLRQLSYATWSANNATYASAFTTALARDAQVDRFQAHVLAVRDGTAAGRRALQQAGLSTAVDVRVDGFGDSPADVALAANALLSAAVSISTSGSYMRASMRHLSAQAVSTALPVTGVYSVTVQLGIGALAGAANAPTGAQIAANLAAVLASNTGALALNNAVGSTAVAVGVPSSKSTKTTAVAAGVGGGGFLFFMLIVCGCVLMRGMRRRAAANNAGAVWVGMPGQQLGEPVYNPMAQQQQQHPGGYAPSGAMYAPSGASYAPSGATYYAQPNQVYMNPMFPVQGQQPAASGYPVQMSVIAPRGTQLQDYQAEQRAQYPSPVGPPPASPVWQLQPQSQPRASDAGLDFTLQQSRASYASSGQSRPSQASSGGGDHLPPSRYAHG